MSQSSAGRRRGFCGRRAAAWIARGRATSASRPDQPGARGRSRIPALVFLTVLLAGCSEMDKYWDRSPTAPEVEPAPPPPPGVTIAFPPEGQRVAARGTLILSATAIDATEGAIAPERITWRSDRDGAIGSGPYLRVKGLSVGTHVLTVSAVNASGTRASASVSVEVMAQPTYAFSTDIYNGILLPRCYSCHYPGALDWANHHLDLRTYAGLMAGGITRTCETIVPCRPESSLVWNKLTADPPWVGSPMPPAPNPKLSATLLERLSVWIREGAPP